MQEGGATDFPRGGNARVQSPTRLSKGAAPLPAWHRIGAPVGGIYREILNTDSAIYGGSNVGNAGAVMADNSPSHGMPFSLRCGCRRSACSGSKSRLSSSYFLPPPRVPAGRSSGAVLACLEASGVTRGWECRASAMALPAEARRASRRLLGEGYTPICVASVSIGEELNRYDASSGDVSV